MMKDLKWFVIPILLIAILVLLPVSISANFRDKGRDNSFLDTSKFGYGYLDLQIEGINKLRYYLGQVSNHNTFYMEEENAEITVRWINLDWVVAQIYSKKVQQGKYDLKYDHVYELVYRFLIYNFKNPMRNNLSFAVEIKRKEKDKPLGFDPKMFARNLRICLRGREIKPSEIISNKPVGAPNTSKYQSENINPQEMRKKYGYYYSVYFSKYKVGQYFIDYEQVIPDFHKLTMEYQIDNHKSYMFFPLDPIVEGSSLSKLVQVRNEILYRLDKEAQKYNLFGEDYQEYVYAPYRKVILPQKIKWYPKNQELKEEQFKTYKEISNILDIDFGFETNYNHKDLKKLFNKRYLMQDK